MVLYISHDPLLDPAAQSQVVAYLMKLSCQRLRLSVLSFERADELSKPERTELQNAFEARGISWRPLVLRERPRGLAILRSLAEGVVSSLRMARHSPPTFVHARSYLAGVIALAVKAVTGAKLVFDMRGFWPEERVELGSFRSHGALYRLSKRCEAVLLRAADHVVVLTESAKSVLRDREASERLSSGFVREKPISVIPCCVDLDRFRPRERDEVLAREHGLDGKLVIGNIGAFNGRYMAPQMFRFAHHVKSHRPEMRFVYLTHRDPSPIREAASAAGLANDDLLVLAVPPSEVPRWLSLFRLGLFFLRPSFAAKGSSFTKLGEFLGSGVPVVTNIGVGDADRILGSRKPGLLLPGLTDRDLASHARIALEFLQGDRVPEPLRESCRATALEHFSLELGVRRYRTLYASLAGFEPMEPATLPAEVL